MNRDRGYNDKIEMDVGGVIEIAEKDIDTTKKPAKMLGLPLDTRKQLLAALRASRKAIAGPTDDPNTVDAEFTKVGA